MYSPDLLHQFSYVKVTFFFLLLSFANFIVLTLYKKKRKFSVTQDIPMLKGCVEDTGLGHTASSLLV